MSKTLSELITMKNRLKDCKNKFDAYEIGYADGVEQGRAEAIEEIDKKLMDRFTCDDIRADWTNADIRETIHFELEQLKEHQNECIQ